MGRHKGLTATAGTAAVVVAVVLGLQATGTVNTAEFLTNSGNVNVDQSVTTDNSRNIDNSQNISQNIVVTEVNEGDTYLVTYPDGTTREFASIEAVREEHPEWESSNELDNGSSTDKLIEALDEAPAAKAVPKGVLATSESILVPTESLTPDVSPTIAFASPEEELTAVSSITPVAKESTLATAFPVTNRCPDHGAPDVRTGYWECGCKHPDAERAAGRPQKCDRPGASSGRKYGCG